MESKIQSRLIKILKAADWFVVKMSKTNNNGIPDLFSQKKGFIDFYCEVKDNNGTIDILQLYRMYEINEKTEAETVIFWPNYESDSIFFEGYEFKVIRTFDEFKFFIEKIMQNGTN